MNETERDADSLFTITSDENAPITHNHYRTIYSTERVIELVTHYDRFSYRYRELLP